MSARLISVIVPVFNEDRYLERVIAALQAQDYPRDRYELIFVDNGSSDDSLFILALYPMIRVFKESREGAYAARNRGLREARGEILAFTDSDCYPLPGWLNAIERGFVDAERHVLLGPRMPPVGNSSVRLVSAYENRKSELVCAGDDPLVYFGYTNNMAVRRRTMADLGPFVERSRGSDTIFVRSVVDALSCEAVGYCPDMTVRHAELESIRVYYNKVRTYGRSRQAYRHIKKVRPLTHTERWRVFREVTHQRPVVDAVYLFTLLVCGQIAWWWGGFGVPRSSS